MSWESQGETGEKGKIPAGSVLCPESQTGKKAEPGMNLRAGAMAAPSYSLGALEKVVVYNWL